MDQPEPPHRAGRPDRKRVALEIAEALRSDREVLDGEFDGLLPAEHRARSFSYWTPVSVALVAARWLEANAALRVLDVGAGVGKFCTVGAAASRHLAFEGIERRAHLVATADALARELGVETRATFRVGDLDDVEFRRYDALYLYNPFAEGYFSRPSWLDDAVELSPRRASADTERLEDTLSSLDVGVHVLTYHGYGGRIPDSYRLRRSFVCGSGRLLCWQKQRASGSGRYLSEADWF